jgi:hypothetical protein
MQQAKKSIIFRANEQRDPFDLNIWYKNQPEKAALFFVKKMRFLDKA